MGGSLLKRETVLLILMVLLVCSGSDSAVPASDIPVFDSSKFILSQTEIPIYELITPEVNQTYAESLAYSLFGFRDSLAEEVEGRFIVNSGNKSFEVDSRDGSIWYSDYNRIWNITLGNDLPSPGTCREIAESWLTDNELLPANAVLMDIGSTNVSAFNLDDGRVLSKILQYQVNYEFVQNEIPIAGEAAQISVIVGDGVSAYDRILGFDWNWREPKTTPYTTATLIEYESILEAYGINSRDVVDHRLVYTVDDDPENNKLLYPVWEIEIVEGDSNGFGVHAILKFDATIFDPEVEIIKPESSITVRPGISISFDCEVKFGNPPYTYQWGSDFDGVLSTAESFSTSTLSPVLKKDIPVPHAISVRVIDAEGRGCSDVVAVTIDENAPLHIDVAITLVAASAVVVLLASYLVLRRRKGAFVFLFLLMMVSAFMIFPAATAQSGLSEVQRYVPSAPTGAYDDGVKEVGIEWVGMSDPSKPLWSTETNIEGFYNWMGSIGGYGREFNWGEYSAWEEDFKDASFSGTDSEWIDAVDFVYYQDHGNPDGVSFTSNHDDTWLSIPHMRLGDGDLDTIIFDACSPLAWENKNGDTVFDRWAPTLQGIHQVCSFASGSHNVQTRGAKFGLYMTGFGILPGYTIIQAWFRATLETESSDVQSAVFYATKSPDPLHPQLDDPINDHAYGFGYVCSDPEPGTFGWYVYIVSNC
jgi:hypothetical protein